MNIEELICIAQKGAVNAFNSYGDVRPVLMAIEDGNFNITCVDMIDKDELSQFLQMLRIKGAQFVLVTEAWMVAVKAPALELALPVSKHPDREEVIYLHVYDPKKGDGYCKCTINDDGVNRCLNDWEEPVFIQMMGKLGNQVSSN